MTIVMFEDGVCDRLAPITTGRLAASITCGSFRLVDWVLQLETTCISLVRPYLRDILQFDFPELSDPGVGVLPDDHRPGLLLNARAVPSAATFFTLRELLSSPSVEPRVVWDRESVAAIVAPPITMREIRQQGLASVENLIAQSTTWSRDARRIDTFQMPHEVISTNMKILRENIEERIRGNQYVQRQDGLFVAPHVEIGEYVLFETASGPIVIEEGAKIGPYTLLRGPIHIGRKCKILEHAAIKDNVSLGHTTKIGGEVEASIVEPFSNKQHHGFLGHSYLGSWINLGAGTCNSDLKNTYGTVNMDYNFGKVATGMQFLGCIMGDYAKSAINTGIFTGKVIGVCSMMYGFVTSNVPSFVNYARLFGQLATLPADVMVATQQRMFARRQVEQRPCDQQLIHDMYRLTQQERDRFGDALSL